MRIRHLVVVLLLAACAAAAGQTKSKPSYPREAGVYAMTPQGPVELTVSGRCNPVASEQDPRCYYSPESFDEIPKAESVQSFYVNLDKTWYAKRVVLVVGREALVRRFNRYELLSQTVENRSVFAFEVFVPDLRSPDFVRSAIRKLTPRGTAMADVEAYVVFELGTKGSVAVPHPIRISVPD